jgi:hypothetical protein
MIIKRHFDNLDNYLKESKALIIYGPRRVGKTTLLKNYLSRTELKYKLDSGDNIRVQQILGSEDFKQILEYAESYQLIAIDEAQRIPKIGQGLKILTDQRPDLKIVATGSSSFDLSYQVGEPLTGRKITLKLYPVAQIELLASNTRHELKEKLDQFLIYGSYPEVVTTKTRREKINILQEIVDSYLLRDILAFDKIKNSKTLSDLLKLLAFQVGNEVSLSELATKLSIDAKTVGRYLDLLEKSFVIFKLTGYSGNLRSEITSKNKYYFLDNGVRNALISQFNPLDSRNDLGALWENFIVCERLKKRTYKNIYGNVYFWRTYGGQEVDLVEEYDGKLHGYECKWSENTKNSAPSGWSSYPNADYSVITPKNYIDFIV